MMTSARIQPIHTFLRALRGVPSRLFSAVVLSLALFVFSALSADLAHAEATANCSFLEIEASNEGKGVDKKLSKLEKKLQRPPFSSWQKFSLLKQHDRKLELTKTDTVPIGTSSKLRVEYKKYTAAKKERFTLHVTLQRKSGKKAVDTEFTVQSGEYLVLSLAPQRDKSYLLAVTCKK